MSDNTWKVVPVEPTEEMVRAARHYSGELPITAATCYRAMLAAAPAPAVEGLEVVAWQDEKQPLRMIAPPMKPEHGDDGWIPLIRRSDAARVIAERDARIAELEEERRGVIAQSKMIEALERRVAELASAKASAEPVASVGGWYAGYPTLRPTNPKMVLPNGLALYSMPPDAQAIIEGLTRERDEALLIHQTDTGTESAVAILQAEVERLTACLKKVNAQAEHFEREWYLQSDVIERLRAELATAQKNAARWSAVEYLMLIGNVELNQDDDGGYSIGVEPVENFAGQVWKGDSPEEAVDKVAAQLEDAAMRAKEEKK